MAVTNEQIQQWFQANPNASDTDIYNAMQTHKVDPTQLTTAMNFDPTDVQGRYRAQQMLPARGSYENNTNSSGTAASTPLNDPFAFLSKDKIASLVDQYSTPQGTTLPPPQPPPVGGLPTNQVATTNTNTGALQTTTTPTYTNFSEPDMFKWFQDFATKNTKGAYNPDAYNVSQQLKDALVATNANPDQVRKFLNSGATVPVYGGANAGGYNVNVKDFANEFDMATSKTPFIDANGKLTLDPTRAAQAAQNELDLLFDPNRGSLMPIRNADFEVGGKYYGRIGERDKMIADWYNDPANQATIAGAQKTVFDKYGVPTNMRLAPRAISSMLARNEVKPAPVVDPYSYGSYEDYSAAQNASSLKAYQDKLATEKKYGVNNFNPTTMANLRAGVAGRDPQAEANFYGMTLENYNNLKSGDKTKPMGQFADVYGTQRLSPIEQIAAQTASAAGMGTPDPRVVALARKYPEIFSKASTKWADYLRKNSPKTIGGLPSNQG